MKRVDPELLHKLFKCDANAGFLYWRKRPASMFKDGKHTAKAAAARWNGKHIGKEALMAKNPYGYRRGKIFMKDYFAHRVIWAMTNGEWPRAEIDHVNHIRDDNRIENLREVTRQGNCLNLSRQIRNTSGVTGVFWEKSRNKWNAKIHLDGKDINLGRFDTLDAATAARAKANKQYGFHPNHGATSVPFKQNRRSV